MSDMWIQFTHGHCVHCGPRVSWHHAMDCGGAATEPPTEWPDEPPMGAVMEWGPLRVVGPITISEHTGHERVVQIGRPDPDSARVIDRWIGGGHSRGGVTLPPDVDPQSLVGQWARGGTIEVAR